MSDEIRECMVLKDATVDVIIIKKGDCSFREAMHKAIDLNLFGVVTIMGELIP